MAKNTTKRILLSLAGATIAFLLTTSSGWAQDPCTWIPQPDGSTFGICVDNGGRQYCVSCPRGTRASSNCPRVSCR
jgi:hypothetical protein